MNNKDKAGFVTGARKKQREAISEFGRFSIDMVPSVLAGFFEDGKREHPEEIRSV